MFKDLLDRVEFQVQIEPWKLQIFQGMLEVSYSQVTIDGIHM